MTQLTQHSIDSGPKLSENVNNMNAGGSWSTNLSYLLIGGGIGAGLALLFAPKAGSELRGDISAQEVSDCNDAETVGLAIHDNNDLVGCRQCDRC